MGIGDMLLVKCCLFLHTLRSNLTGRKSHTEKKQRRSAQAILDKLMREQAAAVTTGAYPAVSCPICFADFETPPEPSAPPLPQVPDCL